MSLQLKVLSKQFVKRFVFSFINLTKSIVEMNRASTHILKEDFIPINIPKLQTKEIEEKNENDFFVLDHSPSPMTISLDSNKKRKNKNLFETIVIPEESPKAASITKPPCKSNNQIMETNDDQDDIDIIFDGINSYIPLESSPRKILKNQMSSPKIACMQKRRFHTMCTICHKCKKPKRHKNGKKSANKTVSQLDDSIILISPSISKVETPQTFMNIDTGKSTTSNHTSSANDSSDDVIIEEVLSDESSPRTELSNNPVQKDLDSDQGENEDSSSSPELSEEPLDPNFIPIEQDFNNIEYTIEVSEKVLNKRQRYEYLRSWEYTSLGRDMASRNGPLNNIFRLVSYNVLSQKLLCDNNFLYKNCYGEHLDWYYRWNLFQHEVRHLSPDILTLQEVESAHYYTHFLPWFTHHGYSGVYKKRTHEKPDGCAIFFRTSKFKLLEHISVEYFQDKAYFLNRDNVGLIVKLCPIDKNQPFCIGTTHLLYNPKRYDIKLSQIVMFLAELDRIAYVGERGGRMIYYPTIITGDFNCEPHSALMEFVRKGSIRYEGLSSKTLSKIDHFSPKLGPELIPPILGIDQHCQHTILSQSRYLESHRGQLFSLKDKRKIEETMLAISHSDRVVKKSKPQASETYRVPSSATSSGKYSHGFDFCSVYSHSLPRLRFAPEVTTNQDKWITVDYIFYSQPSTQEMNPGSLKLLSRYGLVSSGEANYYGPLPSDVCPSDHFPLGADFLLESAE